MLLDIRGILLYWILLTLNVKHDCQANILETIVDNVYKQTADKRKLDTHSW